MTARWLQQAPVRAPGAPWAVPEAAAFLGISPRHLARMIEARKVKAFKIGRRVLLADVVVKGIAAEGVR